MDSVPQKCCPTCKNFYPDTLEFFYSNKSQRSGIANECKRCKKARSRASYYTSRPRSVEPVPPGYKRCAKCKEVKSATAEQFFRHGHAKDGLYSYCKECSHARNNLRNISTTPGCKCCTKCGETKPFSEFYKAKRISDGHQSWCKVCRKEDYRKGYLDRIARQLRSGVIPASKDCSTCKQHKPASEFSLSSEHGLMSQCKACCKASRQRNAGQWQGYSPHKHREYGLKYRYNLTIEEYETMYQIQFGLCAICGLAEAGIHNRTGEVRRLGVDHCHKTGLVRELLCYRCNTLIGLAEGTEDPIGVLQRAIEYLKKHTT